MHWESIISTYIAETNGVFTSLTAINAIGMTGACLIHEIMVNQLSSTASRSNKWSNSQSPQIAEDRLHSIKHSEEPQFDMHCKYWSSQFEVHSKLRS